MELELKNIYKNFGEKQVLTGISLNDKSGEAFGLLGRNGAGKTTTIRILMNVFPANAGEVLVDGKPINYNKIGIGYLPEERGLYPKKPIIDQLIYFAQLKGMKYAPAVKSIDKWLERLGMSEYRNKRLDTLSKGNQQKIQLITALAHNPDIVILDEPFSGLDPVNAQLLKDVVKEEINRGKIVLFSSHQMNYIEEFCDNIAILNGGKVVLQGNLHNIKRNYTRDKLIVKSLTDIEKILTNQGVKSEKSVKRLDSDTLILELNSPDNKQNVMKMLTEQFDIDEIKVFEPSLNDIFVEYAGKQV
ncbi:MAG: ATP-binding cassette domain-containing protein [Ruminococcus bromii]|nr:ATP-binding cassette domain-containing protein [Ruminococcus bromii]